MDTCIVINEHSMCEACGTLVYSQETRRYLFLLRDNTTFKGTWGLPGGKIEPHETILAGLTREINEEIGNIEALKIIPVEKFTSSSAQFIYHTFLIIVANEFVPQLNCEHRGHCWVELRDLPTPLHPGVWRMFNFIEVQQKLKTVELVNPPQH